MLTLGWSDGHSFMLVDFSLLSTNTAQINGISEGIDKRTSGYKRRLEALQRPHPNRFLQCSSERWLQEWMPNMF